MDQLIYYPTDKGHYAVRPIDWACFLDNGTIKENGQNHIAIFAEERDAKEYCIKKNMENHIFDTDSDHVILVSYDQEYGRDNSILVTAKQKDDKLFIMTEHSYKSADSAWLNLVDGGGVPKKTTIFEGEIAEKLKNKGLSNFETYKCPVCNHIVASKTIPNSVYPDGYMRKRFCEACGLKLKWDIGGYSDMEYWNSGK